MAQKRAQKKTGTPRKRRKLAGHSIGLLATELSSGARQAAVDELQAAIESDGGRVLATYREPFSGHWVVLASLPIDQVEPTPYQRNLSDAHVRKLESVIAKLGRFLDPIIVVRKESKDSSTRYWTPNGNHRLSAMKTLGAKCIVALVVPEPAAAYQILALNTEKAHNLRERALEVIRLAENLAELDPRPEKEFESEFEEPSLLTLGLCYQENGRFAGGAYHPVLKRIEKFLSAPLPKALETRRERAARVLELDDAVTAAVKELKTKGFESPYLRAFVVARINPLRFKRGAVADFDETIERMLAGARRFDPGRIRADQVARAGGAPEE